MLWNDTMSITVTRYLLRLQNLNTYQASKIFTGDQGQNDLLHCRNQYL